MFLCCIPKNGLHIKSLCENFRQLDFPFSYLLAKKLSKGKYLNNSGLNVCVITPGEKKNSKLSNQNLFRKSENSLSSLRLILAHLYIESSYRKRKFWSFELKYEIRVMHAFPIQRSNILHRRFQCSIIL